MYKMVCVSLQVIGLMNHLSFVCRLYKCGVIRPMKNAGVFGSYSSMKSNKDVFFTDWGIRNLPVRLCFALRTLIEACSNISHPLTDDFNEKRLLPKAFASLEEYGNYSRALVDEGRHRVSVIQLRSMLGKWCFVASRVKRERSLRERKARKHGNKLLMLRAIHSWQLGVSYCKEEREMDKMIQAKWSEVNKWLKRRDL